MNNVGSRAEHLFEQIDELVQRILQKEKLLLIHPEDIWQSASKEGVSWRSMNPKFDGRLELYLNEPLGLVNHTLSFRAAEYNTRLLQDDSTVVVTWRHGYTNEAHEATFCLDDAESYEQLIGKIRWLVLRAFTFVDSRPLPPLELPRKRKAKLTRAERWVRRRNRKRLRAISRRK